MLEIFLDFEDFPIKKCTIKRYLSGSDVKFCKFYRISGKVSPLVGVLLKIQLKGIFFSRNSVLHFYILDWNTIICV